MDDASVLRILYQDLRCFCVPGFTISLQIEINFLVLTHLVNPNQIQNTNMRFDKITKIAGLTACAAALPLSAVAQEWQLIDDFESYTQNHYEAGGSPDLPYPYASNGGRGYMDIWGTADGIDGVGGAQAAHFWFGVVDADLGDIWHQLPLPQEIALGETGTVYWRMWQDGYLMNYHFMLSRVPAGEEPQRTALWSHMAAVMRINGADPVDLEVRDGSSYIHSNPPVVPALETWYEFWMVAHNTSNGAGTYEIYRRAPGETEPQLLTWGDNRTSLDFRNTDPDSIKTLVLNRNTDDNTDVGQIYLVDDIWFSAGENLTTPGDEVPDCDNPWADWCDEDGDGWVDTGAEFLHWIYFDGTGWVFVEEMDQWVFLPAENVTSSGAWTYLPRL